MNKRARERVFFSLSLSLSLSRQRDRPPDADETKKRKSSRKRERGRGADFSLSKPNAHRTNNSMWSLALSSFFFTTFFHPLLSLSLCVSKKSTNLSPRLDRIEKERERNPRHRIQKPRGDRNISPNFQISLSLSRRRDDINKNTSLLSLFLYRVVVVVIVAIHRANGTSFFPRPGKSLPPRLLSQNRKIQNKTRF